MELLVEVATIKVAVPAIGIFISVLAGNVPLDRLFDVKT